METGKIIPEDALNLELKYLDENIRPFLESMDKAYVKYLLSGEGALVIVANGLAAIHAINRIDRLEKKEIEDLRKGFKLAWELRGKKQVKALNEAMDALGEKIGRVSLYSRVGEGRKRSVFTEDVDEDKDAEEEDD